MWHGHLINLISFCLGSKDCNYSLCISMRAASFALVLLVSMPLYLCVLSYWYSQSLLQWASSVYSNPSDRFLQCWDAGRDLQSSRLLCTYFSFPLPLFVLFYLICSDSRDKSVMLSGVSHLSLKHLGMCLFLFCSQANSFIDLLNKPLLCEALVCTC